VSVYDARCTYLIGYTGLVVETSLLRLFLGEPDGGQLRIGEDHRGEEVVLGAGAVAGEHVLDGDPCLVLCDGRELMRAGDVAGGPDTVDRRAELVVDRDSVPRPLDPDLLQFQLLDVRQPSCGEQDLRDPDLVVAEARDDVAAFATDAGDSDSRPELDPFVLERCGELVGGRGVRTR
jgi:hypothetical protein